MDGRTTYTRIREAYETYQATASRDTKGEAESEWGPEDIIRDIHDTHIAMGEDLGTDQYPELYNISAAFMFNALPIPIERKMPEFVYVPSTAGLRNDRDECVQLSVAISEWNMCWESGQQRLGMFDSRLPGSLEWLRKQSDENIYLLPRNTEHKYNTHSVLFHMLPNDMLAKYGLPSLKKGIWPHIREDIWTEALLPRDFDSRLSRAFADLIWGAIDSGSSLAAFSNDDSLRLLAHNLDFWLPYAYRVAESRLIEFPRVVNPDAISRYGKDGLQGYSTEEYEVHQPRMGGAIWKGAEEANQAVLDLINEADCSGHLRGVIDAIRSNRVEEDFSDRWSYAKEDFERKLYKKRSKVSVKFVEINDTIPVHGPESEVHEDLLWEDFLAVLDAKERQVTVLLRNGRTKLGDIAQELGYANHSPVSKALSRIRNKAAAFFEL